MVQIHTRIVILLEAKVRMVNSILCRIGIHKPCKCKEIIFYGKRFQVCERCGKLLDTIKVEDNCSCSFRELK